MAGLALLAVGCVTEVETPDGEATGPDLAQQPAPNEGGDSAATKKKIGHGFGPSAMLVHAALHDLELTDGQRSSLEDLVADTSPGADGFAAHKELMATLAAGLRGGAIDDEAVDTKLAAVHEVTGKHHQKMVAALDTLHDTLTAAQRTELVAIVRARGKAMEKRFEEKRHAKGDNKSDNHEKHERKHARSAGWFARGLDLSDAQREELATALTDAGVEQPNWEKMKEGMAAWKANMTAMLDAFPADDFDAKLHTAAITTDKAEKGLNHYVEVVKALSVILTVEQRDKLADKLEKGPHAGKHGKHGK